MRSRITAFRRRGWLLPGLLVLSNVFEVADATAQTETVSPDAAAVTPAVAQARAAFSNGIELARQGRWIDALSALTRSNELRPHAVTTYNIGYCERSLGRYTRARKVLTQALVAHKASGEKELSSDLVTAAQLYLDESERQIARVTVTVVPEAAAVKVDGRPLELVDAYGPHPLLLAGTRDVGPGEVVPAQTFDLQLDPGTHEFVISTKNQGDIATSQTLLPGSNAAMQLNGPDAREVPKKTAEPTGQPNRTPVWIAFGIGGVAAIVGTVSGVIAFGKKSAVNDPCSGPTCGENRQSGYRAADISTGAFIVAGLGAGVGVVLLLATPGPKPTGGATTANSERGFVRPFVGLKNIGVEGRF